jgi:hypothetical protein
MEDRHCQLNQVGLGVWRCFAFFRHSQVAAFGILPFQNVFWKCEGTAYWLKRTRLARLWKNRW